MVDRVSIFDTRLLSLWSYIDIIAALVNVSKWAVGNVMKSIWPMLRQCTIMIVSNVVAVICKDLNLALKFFES